MPRFHHDTLRRLGVEYAADPASMRALNERAAGLGITLPASFVALLSSRWVSGEVCSGAGV